MDLHYFPFDLKFRHPFKIASGSRDSTPVVFVELSYQGHTGYGEASLPPYLPETQESVMAFLNKFKVSNLPAVFELYTFIDLIRGGGENNFSAKAALDIAAYDLHGKINQQQVFRIWSKDEYIMPLNTFTLGMDKPAVLIEKIAEAAAFKLLKIKLGGPFDKLIIKTIRENTDKPICVDVNQGWQDEYFALDMITWLAEQGVIFVEQPLPKTDKKKYAWLKEKSPLPIIGDESIQGFDDLIDANELFHGINIKLMKCGGLWEARRMIVKAKELKLKILIGCMSESSCGVMAAAQLAPFADWTDLDGPLLITNDPFEGIAYKDGKIVFSEDFGIGIKKKNNKEKV